MSTLIYLELGADASIEATGPGDPLPRLRIRDGHGLSLELAITGRDHDNALTLDRLATACRRLRDEQPTGIAQRNKVLEP